MARRVVLVLVLLTMVLAATACGGARKDAARTPPPAASSSAAATNPSKRDVFVALLESGVNVYVNLDPRRAGVQLPDRLRHEPRVVLVYGKNLPTPIPDMQVTEAGIRGTLSFDATPHMTFVPWSAVFAIVTEDERGMLWKQDVPADLKDEDAEDKHI